MKIQDTLIEIQELQQQVEELKQENCELKSRNEFLERMVRGLKLHNKELTKERNGLIEELNRIKAMGVWEFANTYCDDKRNEEASRQLARSLLGKPMTSEDLAIEEAENNYIPYSGDDF